MSWKSAWAALALFNTCIGRRYRMMPEPARRLSHGQFGSGLGILTGLALTLCLSQMAPMGGLLSLLSRLYRQ